ncbi:MAG: hypothetical protein KA007_02450 [Candidatus Pacebacteria bacterium]|nr:hypothetical protein [Candidatus Paceibacterota bacterium]
MKKEETILSLLLESARFLYEFLKELIHASWLRSFIFYLFSVLSAIFLLSGGPNGKNHHPYFYIIGIFIAFIISIYPVLKLIFALARDSMRNSDSK